ncbi:MAG: MOSC domain-containing protein [Nitrospinota bacterium]
MENNNCGKVVSLCISRKKGTPKTRKDIGRFIENYGIEMDAHASPDFHRQVSLLGIESIAKMQALGLNVRGGSFAENITTKGIELLALKIGERLLIGNEVILEITQIGKECHTKCAIFYKAGDCVMPKEGIFAKVVKGGIVSKSDSITPLYKQKIKCFLKD